MKQEKQIHLSSINKIVVGLPSKLPPPKLVIGKLPIGADPKFSFKKEVSYHRLSAEVPSLNVIGTVKLGAIESIVTEKNTFISYALDLTCKAKRATISLGDDAITIIKLLISNLKNNYYFKTNNQHVY